MEGRTVGCGEMVAGSVLGTALGLRVAGSVLGTALGLMVAGSVLGTAVAAGSTLAMGTAASTPGTEATVAELAPATARAVIGRAMPRAEAMMIVRQLRSCAMGELQSVVPMVIDRVGEAAVASRDCG